MGCIKNISRLEHHPGSTKSESQDSDCTLTFLQNSLTTSSGRERIQLHALTMKSGGAPQCRAETEIEISLSRLWSSLYLLPTRLKIKHTSCQFKKYKTSPLTHTWCHQACADAMYEWLGCSLLPRVWKNRWFKERFCPLVSLFIFPAFSLLVFLSASLLHLSFSSWFSPSALQTHIYWESTMCLFNTFLGTLRFVVCFPIVLKCLVIFYI